MKNVFVEGIQGMGKSTLINYIYEKMPEYRICREGDYSPVDLAWCTWMTKEEYESVLLHYEAIKEEIIKNTTKENDHYIISYTKIITNISNFHKDLEKYEIYNGRKSFEEMKEIILTRYNNFREMGYLLECAFFQNIIEDLILFHLLNDDEIVDFYRELYQCVDRQQFVLLYLYSDNVKENIDIIRKERSDNMGNELWYNMMLEYFIHSPYGEKHRCSNFEDMIAHFKHRQQLELRIINEVIGDNAIILPAKQWKKSL
ncbi:MAG: hypothetical protein E7266_04690 [Lachnospiraceae bacterium]|nr:hypothetical protein [Lachnospiraceae bacterium]